MPQAPYISCSYSHICSGCTYPHLSQDEVRQLRHRDLLALHILNDASPSVEFKWIDVGGLRDRLEFTLDTDGNNGKRLGLYSKIANGQRRELLDLEGCPQLSKDLEAWLQDFRRDLPPLKKKAGIRLRVSPSGLRGAWIDAANEDIRDLLDDGQWLERQIQNGIVIEAGQKRKRVVLREPPDSRRVELVDPLLEAWFETSGDPALKVFGTVGTFTQPGFRAGKILVETVNSHLDRIAACDTHRITELGSGSGTFTLAQLAKGYHIRAFEFDQLAVLALERGLEVSGLQPPHQQNRLQVFRGDFIQSAKAFQLPNAAIQGETTSPLNEVLLVDPPRTGLGAFLERILTLESYSHASWIYVSCFPESFAKDLQRLQQSGYHLTRLSVVEQFPFTSHFELVATIERRREPA